MDFKEYLLKRNKTGKEKLYTVLIYLVATVLALFSFVMLFSLGSIFGGINLLVPVGIYYGAHKISERFKKEFEYIITDDLVDIDVVFNASRRKRLISFSIKEAEVLASVTNKEKNAVLNGDFDEVIDATTNSKGANVFFVVVDQDKRKLVKFEPPYAALEILRKHAPSKVFISE